MNTNMHGDKTLAGGTDDGGGRRRSLWKSPALITALILLIPLLGNHFVDGWNWSPGGFVLVGTLLFGIGLTYELVTRNRDAIAYRPAVGVAFAAAFLLAWVNVVQLADVTPAAVMYFGVPIVGGHRCRRSALAPKWHGTRLVRHRVRSSVGPGGCADYTDYSKSSGYLLDTACIAGGWSECVFRHAVCRVGVVVSESRAWGVRTGRGITKLGAMERCGSRRLSG